MVRLPNYSTAAIAGTVLFQPRAHEGPRHDGIEQSAQLVNRQSDLPRDLSRVIFSGAFEDLLNDFGALDSEAPDLVEERDARKEEP